MTTRRHVLNQPELFDVAELDRLERVSTSWTGPAPLSYTTEYFTPAELEAAFNRWIDENEHFDCFSRSHMWHMWEKPVVAGEHTIHVLNANTHCSNPEHDHSVNPLPDGGNYQANCPRCRWHAIGDEAEVIAAWHDHAMPGWRDLPVLPAKHHLPRDDKGRAAALAWVEQHYPAQWQFAGAPVLTQREPYGTRAVPGASPFGGYDLPSTAKERKA